MERAMRRAKRQVQKKGLARGRLLLVTQHSDCLVHQVLAEVVALVNGFCRQDARRIANQVGFVLRRLASQDS